MPWTQTIKEVTWVVPLPAGAKAKDVKFKLSSKAIDMTCLGEVLLKGDFFYSVRADDSTWELEDAPGGGGARQVRVTLGKTKKNQKWDCCFMDEIDETMTVRCFMDIAVGGRKMGRVVYGLYGNAYPKTVENFRCLCTGEKGAVRVAKSKKIPPIRLHYKGTTIFRVVPGFVCQGGDVTHHPQNMNGRSIYGHRFEDEGFKIKHKGAGDLLMANFGEANNNHSQFAVAMSHLTEFETKHVIFGKVVDGMDLLRVLELEGSGEGNTKRPIQIVDCGELDADGNVKATAAADGGEAAASVAPSESGAAEEEDEEGEDGPLIEEVDGDDDDDGPVLEDEPTAAPPATEAPLAGAGKAAAADDDDDDGPLLEVQ